MSLKSRLQLIMTTSKSDVLRSLATSAYISLFPKDVYQLNLRMVMDQKKLKGGRDKVTWKDKLKALGRLVTTRMQQGLMPTIMFGGIPIAIDVVQRKIQKAVDRRN